MLQVTRRSRRSSPSTVANEGSLLQACFGRSGRRDLAWKNPAAAARFEARISQIEERVGRFPEAFQQVESRPDYRRVPLYRHPYLLFYTIAAGEAVVLRILHGARKEPWEEL